MMKVSLNSLSDKIEETKKRTAREDQMMKVSLKSPSDKIKETYDQGGSDDESFTNISLR